MLTHQTGVTFETGKTTFGYMLLSPAAGDHVYLVDSNGVEIHQWKVGKGITHWGYLLPNGNLFVNERCEQPEGVELTVSGAMREYDSAGKMVWEHIDPWQHHDARRLANGNTVYLAYTPLTPAEQASIRGGVAGSESVGGIYGECIRETDPQGKVVWEWDFRQFSDNQFPLHPSANRWSRGHTNTVFPMPDGNYLISCKTLNLLFIISRTTNEVLWHFQDNRMGGQHDAQLLDNGNILLFANGAYAADLHHSQVWELNPNNKEIVWRYAAKDNPQSFFSPHIGGCQRLTSGNTLICEGAKGCVFEVTPQGEIIWEYISPYQSPTPEFGLVNWLFRVRHYPPEASEVQSLIAHKT